MDTDKIYKKAVMKLTLKSPILGVMIQNFEVHFTDTLPTFASDNKNIWLNPDYFNSLEEKQQIFVLGFVVLQPILEHTFRKGDKDEQKWDAACSIVSYEMLQEDGIGEAPENWLYDTKRFKKGGEIVEGVYNILPDGKSKDSNEDSEDEESEKGGQNNEDSDDQNGEGSDEQNDDKSEDESNQDKDDKSDEQNDEGDSKGESNQDKDDNQKDTPQHQNQPNPKGKENYGQKDQPCGHVMQAQGTSAEIRNEKDYVQGIFSQALTMGKAIGDTTTNIQRLLTESLETKVDWKTVLQDFLQKTKVSERSFARPNRRFLSQNLYLPTNKNDENHLTNLVFAVDCSCSIGEYELNQYASEIRKVHEDNTIDNLHIIYFDHEVCHHDVFEEDDDDVKITPRGGGGTAFSPVFKHIEKDINEPPTAVVFLTDLWCDDFGEEPEYPVLWITTDREEAPFGDIVKMEIWDN